MWTSPRHRRRGHARTVLTALQDLGRERGYARVRLETGPAQPEALALYRQLGFAEIPLYGRYEVAVAFERSLVAS
jgi:ribosomal protein S18 acetylase RimI-like enzyme